MGKILRSLCALVAVLMIGACASGPAYVPDPALTAATGATVYGSKHEGRNIFAGDTRTVVTAIDGQVTDARSYYDWDVPVLVSQGQHTVQIALRFGQSSSTLAAQWAFDAGKTYVVRGERRGRKVADVWLEEKDGSRIIGEKMTVCMQPDAVIMQVLDGCK